MVKDVLVEVRYILFKHEFLSLFLLQANNKGFSPVYEHVELPQPNDLHT